MNKSKKRNYEKPLVVCETFVSNRSIADSCAAQEVTMTCLAGKDTDNTHVITSDNSACTYKAAVTQGNISKVSGSGISTYSNSSQCKLLYICLHDRKTNGTPDPFEATTSNFNESNGVLTHSGHSHDKKTRWHCQIAPVANASTVAIAS